MPELPTEQSYLVTGSLMLLAAVAGSFALYWTASLLIPLVLALLLTYLVAPLVDVLQVRLGAPRWAAITSALVVIAGMMTLLTLLLYTSALGIADNGDLYLERVGAMATWALEQLDRLPPGVVPPEWTADTLDPQAVLAQIDLRAVFTTLGTGAGSVLGVVANLVSNAVLVVMFAVYLLSGRKPRTHRTGIWGEIDRSVQSYLGTKFVMSAATGVLTWALLALLGLDLAMVFGVLAFLLNFIPSLGSVIATALPVPIALMQFEAWWMVALVVLLPGAVQFTIGNVLEPMVMGENLDMHPITVLLTLVFWALLWGPVGMVLAVPLTSVAKIVMEKFETTRPIAELLAGRLGGAAEEATAVS